MSSHESAHFELLWRERRADEEGLWRQYRVLCAAAVLQHLRLNLTAARATRDASGLLDVHGSAGMALLTHDPEQVAVGQVPHFSPTGWADLARARFAATTEFLRALGRVMSAARARREADHAPR